MSCGGLCCDGMEVAVSPAAPVGLASCCHGWALAAGLLPAPGPPAWPTAAPNQSYQLQTTHGRALPQSNTCSSWLVAADCSQPFRPASVLLQFLSMQKASGASGFSSRHGSYRVECCHLHLQIILEVKTRSRQMLKASTWTLPLHAHCNLLLWLCYPSAPSCWSLGCCP